MSSTTVPVYFEESWAILSSIGLVNILFGLMIIGITSLSPISLVPVIVSVAGAIANGLCYYAYYADYPKTGTAVAAAIGDLAWLIQEAGLSFYSYMILTRILKQKDRIIFKGVFWTMMIIISIFRLTILTSRVKDIVKGTTKLQHLIDHLHIGYFSSIAIVECISAFFLLREFISARRTSLEAASKSGLFSYLLRSTEIRLTTLAFIGFSRSITYSFQTTAQSATSVASQVDRFVYTLECLFPVMMFIDILASKLVVTNHAYGSSSHNRSRAYDMSASRNRGQNRGVEGGEIPMYSMSNIQTTIDAKGVVSSSQEHIVEGTGSRAGTVEGGESTDFDRGGKGISKTVEFEFYESTM